MEKLLHRGDNVTIVNRGNWYWDSKERIKPHVNYINCDRKNKLSSCTELVQLTNSLGKGDLGLFHLADKHAPPHTHTHTALLYCFDYALHWHNFEQ